MKTIMTENRKLWFWFNNESVCNTITLGISCFWYISSAVHSTIWWSTYVVHWDETFLKLIYSVSHLIIVHEEIAKFLLLFKKIVVGRIYWMTRTTSLLFLKGTLFNIFDIILLVEFSLSYLKAYSKIPYRGHSTKFQNFQFLHLSVALLQNKTHFHKGNERK